MNSFRDLEAVVRRKETQCGQEGRIVDKIKGDLVRNARGPAGLRY